MPFTPGYNPDKQSRVARQAQDQNQVTGPLPLISSGGAPAVIEFDWTNPTFAARDRQARVALLAGQFDQVQGFTAGTMPAAAATTLPPGQRVFDLPPRAASRAQTDTYTQADASEFWMLVDSVNPGKQSVDLPPRAAARARDYSITAAFPLELIGQDAMATGAQSADLPPRAASRLRDYSITQALPINLLIPVGAQSVDLPPRGALRARDYTLAASFPLELIGQDAVNPGVQSAELPPRAAARARDYSITAAFPLELIGQDATLVGDQSTDSLPPRAPARARDYSITESFTLELIGQDSLPVGGQLSGNAPAGPRRASQLSETGVNLTVELTAAPPVIPPGQSTGASELTPRAAQRARDYTIAASYPLELIGKDQFYGVAGEAQAFDWQNPRGAARLRDYTWIQDPMPVVPMGQSTAATELAPRGAARARDYSIAASFPLELISQDRLFGAAGQPQALDWQLPTPAARRTYALYEPGTNLTILLPVVAPALPPGQQSTDLSPRAPARSKEYGQGSGFPLELNGKDQVYAASGEVPSYDWPNPRGPQRARSYDWFQSFPLYVYQQLPPGQSTGGTELTPRAALRAKDYTYLQPLSLELYGQDQMYGRPGEVPAYDWQLPTPRAPRMQDYSITQTAPYGAGIPPRDLAYTLGLPQSRWTVGSADSRWTASTPVPG